MTTYRARHARQLPRILWGVADLIEIVEPAPDGYVARHAREAQS